jgi:5-methylcytosine-specific restriction endonuclease McrA
VSLPSELQTAMVAMKARDAIGTQSSEFDCEDTPELTKGRPAPKEQVGGCPELGDHGRCEKKVSFLNRRSYVQNLALPLYKPRPLTLKQPATEEQAVTMANETQLTVKNFCCPRCFTVAVSASRIWVDLHMKDCQVGKRLEKKINKAEKRAKRKRIVFKTESAEEFKGRVVGGEVQKKSNPDPESKFVELKKKNNRKDRKQLRREIVSELMDLSKQQLIDKLLHYKDLSLNLQNSVVAERKKKRVNYSFHEFYDSREWKQLRYKVLNKYGRTCALCRKSDGVMHVDHIKPRSKYPELELVFDNLQVLCEACNIGKSNTDETDFRAAP